MIKLILVFMYVGLFTIGGGLVAIPLIQQEVVERGWISLGDFYQMVAIAESTPGPIGINIATYVGFSQFGVVGSLLATVGFIIPSFTIVSVLSKLLREHRDKLLVKNWLLFVKTAVVGLIGYALMNVAEYALIDTSSRFLVQIESIIALIFLSITYYLLRKKPWITIIIGAVVGILFL